MALASVMSRRYIPGRSSPGMAGHLGPLPSVGRGGATPTARPLRGPIRGGAFVAAPPVSPSTPAGARTGAMGERLHVGGDGSDEFGGAGSIPHSVWAGQYANEEQSIIGNAREQAALERERAIAGGYANSAYFRNRMRTLLSNTNALLAKTRRDVAAQEANAFREDYWRRMQMQQAAGGMSTGRRGGGGGRAGGDVAEGERFVLERPKPKPKGEPELEPEVESTTVPGLTPSTRVPYGPVHPYPRPRHLLPPEEWGTSREAM